MPGAYHRVRFAIRGRQDFVEIDTTRPELIPACVALVAHPDDTRYQPLFGKDVLTPLFKVPVPVRAHALADPEKGTGIAMICTFGDVTDVTWWRELALPVRAIIQTNGAFQARDVGLARAGKPRTRQRRSSTTTPLAGLSAVKARARIVDQLRESGDLIGDPRPITHHVKFYEKGDRPLEIVTQPAVVRQDDGLPGGDAAARARARVASGAHARALRELGERTERRLVHQPPAVLRRAVSGLVSRSRGRHARLRRAAGARRGSAADRSVNRPCRTGSVRTSAACRADSSAIPTSWTRGPRRRSRRSSSADGKPIPTLFKRTYPMDMRPQAHDIIRTWLFSTVLRSHLEENVLRVEERRDLRLGARSGSQEDVEVEGQRRDADGPARGARLRCRALLGGEGRPGRGHGVRTGSDAGRPPARDQAAERLEVRALGRPRRPGR